MTLKPRKSERSNKDERLDRHSGSGRLGLPKKQGAGGKYVWGDIMISEGPAVLDEGDPNYDPEQDPKKMQNQEREKTVVVEPGSSK